MTKLAATPLGATPIPLLPVFAVILALSIIISVGAKALWKHDPREPVLVTKSRILGHLPGIWRYGTSYPEVLR